jgi:hypothetical protein
MTFRIDADVAAPDQDQRWRILQRALAQTITSFDQQIAMGAKFFPEALDSDEVPATQACQTAEGVGIAPARGNAARILSVFDTTTPNGGTPTSEAVRIAADFLSASRSIARTIVLATDGAPNCNEDLESATCVCTTPPPVRTCFPTQQCLDDVRTIQTIKTVATDQKIPVYVVGIGAQRPEFQKVLSDMAVAGGRPLTGTTQYYTAQSETDLDNALGTIRDLATKCTYFTPSAPKDPNGITVSVDGVVVPRDQSKQNGWDWIDQPLGEIALFGPACAKAQANVSASFVDGVVRCD